MKVGVQRLHRFYLSEKQSFVFRSHVKQFVEPAQTLHSQAWVSIITDRSDPD